MKNILIHSFTLDILERIKRTIKTSFFICIFYNLLMDSLLPDENKNNIKFAVRNILS